MKIHSVFGRRCGGGAALVWLILFFTFGAEREALAQRRMLAPCPSSPNCVCSDDPDPDRRIAPLKLAAPPDAAWDALKELLRSLPRVTVTRAGESGIEAQAESRVFGFVDDLAFQLHPTEETIAVRSASRTGYYDFGVNRRRVEEIRDRLRAARVVE
jgi:uncharacterized protein (DUF1499 family)